MDLHLPAHPEQMGQVYGLLARFDEATEPWLSDGMVYPAFMTAVVEIATNIMRHAYPTSDAPATEAAADSSETATPGMFTLTLTLFKNRLHAEFRDQGVPLSSETAGGSTTGPLAGLSSESPADELLDLPEGGFGLFVARQALDVLDYRRTPEGDNCWILVKEF